MPPWALTIRSLIGRSGSPKYPMPKVVVHTIVNAMTNAAAPANTGWQRAASHSTSENSNANGTTVANDTCGRKMTSEVVNDIAANSAADSQISFSYVNSTTASAIPIISSSILTTVH